MHEKHESELGHFVGRSENGKIKYLPQDKTKRNGRNVEQSRTVVESIPLIEINYIKHFYFMQLYLR